MGIRRFNYIQPTYLQKADEPKQLMYPLDFGQLERKSDYYRRQAGLNRYAVSVMFILFFLSLFGVYGFSSLVPGTHLPEVTLPKQQKELVLVKPTATQKVVESVSFNQEERSYSYTIQNGDSYARLVKRAVTDFSEDRDIELSRSELNSVVYLIISGLEREPLHPGNTFTISSATINDVLLPLKP